MTGSSKSCVRVRINDIILNTCDWCSSNCACLPYFEFTNTCLGCWYSSNVFPENEKNVLYTITKTKLDVIELSVVKVAPPGGLTCCQLV